jgi:hypothetical protein
LTDDAGVREPASEPTDDVVLTSAVIRPTPRSLLLVSTAFLTVQVVVTDYGEDNSGAAGLWFAVGCLLLWLVHRKRSRVARGIIVVTALVGAVIYSFGALMSLHAALLAFAHLGQAVPLLMRPVRQRVQTRS